MAAQEQFGNYDFGLNAEQEAHAKKLHYDSIVIDMLFQGPLGYRHFSEEMVEERRQQLQSGVNRNIVFWTEPRNMVRASIKGELPEYRQVWEESGLTAVNRDMPVENFEDMARTGSLWTAMTDNMDWLVKALKAADIRRAKDEGKRAIFINHQASTSFSNDLSLLDAAYDFGLRVLMLTYNSLTNVGAGCTERTDAGLSRFGVRVVEHLNELDIIVDTSHCGKQTTLDACEFSKAPVIATHATAQGVYHHNRGKSDEEIRAIAASGGLIGVVTVPFFLGKENVTVDTFLDHVDYINNLVGWQHIGIGTDWPMMNSRWALEHILQPLTKEIGFLDEDNVDALSNVAGFDDYRDLPNITRGLVKRGYTEEQIKGILGENFLHVFEQVCG